MRAEDFVRPHLLKLKAYTPIEPFEILAQRLGRDAKDIVKLDANENPYGPPPEVLAALGSMAWPNIYPDPESRRLREALAAWNNVPVEHLLVRLPGECCIADGGGWRAAASGEQAANPHFPRLLSVAWWCCVQHTISSTEAAPPSCFCP